MTAFDAELTILLATGTEVEVLTRYEQHWTTGFEIAAVDYSYLPDGGLVVFESNPYPSITGWWADDPIFQARLVEAVSDLLYRAAGGR